MKELKEIIGIIFFFIVSLTPIAVTAEGNPTQVNTETPSIDVSHIGRRPSEYIMLVNKKGKTPVDSTCLSSGSFTDFVRLFPDGTTSSDKFIVPAGKVLVITDINGSVDRSSISKPAGIGLFIKGNITKYIWDAQIFYAGIRFSEQYKDYFSDNLTSGIIVSSKVNLVSNCPGDHGNVFVNGYLMTDN